MTTGIVELSVSEFGLNKNGHCSFGLIFPIIRCDTTLQLNNIEQTCVVYITNL